MHPYLVDQVLFGIHFHIPSYGVLLAFSFSVAYFMALYQAFKLEEDPRHIEYLFLIIVFSSMLGSRLFHVVFEEPEYYLAHPKKILAIWEGGYTFYGALIAAIFSISVYCKWHKLRFLQFSDIATAGTLLGLSTGRVGCFLAGCCWGRPTNMPWGVSFTHAEAFTTLKAVPLHPAQLYESAGAFLLFLYSLNLFRKRKFIGQITFHGLIGYAAIRFVVEYFRGDDYRGYMFGGFLSYSQFISIIILVVSLYFMRQAKRSNLA